MTLSLLAASRIPFFGGFILRHTSRSGTVYIQSLPFSRLADRIIASAPRAGGNSRDEGSLLGGLGVYSMETDDFKFNKRLRSKAVYLYHIISPNFCQVFY
jgi:hypothetical protein